MGGHGFGSTSPRQPAYPARNSRLSSSVISNSSRRESVETDSPRRLDASRAARRRTQCAQRHRGGGLGVGRSVQSKLCSAHCIHRSSAGYGWYPDQCGAVMFLALIVVAILTHSVSTQQSVGTLSGI